MTVHFGGNRMTALRVRKIEKLFKARGPVLPASALRSIGFCGKDMGLLVREGYLQKLRRGYYALNETALDEYAVVASLIPEGIITLFSAAAYHDMTTVIPASIEITLPTSMRIPVLPSYPPITVYKSIYYDVGVEAVKQKGYTLKVYDRERTLCEFFRMRLQIGKDAALEVLKRYMAGRKNLQKLYEYADTLRIKKIIEPYVEASL
jgi:predicted transcriptional regulator of viral defense system